MTAIYFLARSDAGPKRVGMVAPQRPLLNRQRGLTDFEGFSEIAACLFENCEPHGEPCLFGGVWLPISFTSCNTSTST